MLYVPFTIIYFAKYFFLMNINVYIHIRELLLSDIFIGLILLDILISNTFIYCYAFIIVLLIYINEFVINYMDVLIVLFSHFGCQRSE